MSALYTGPVTGLPVVDMMQTTEKKRVTLQDIASRTGVSVNTVSHALRNKSDISAETCRRIQEAAREMGYTGNQIARSLRSGRTHIIAVILGGLSNPFYGILSDAIQDAAAFKRYTVMVMCSRDDPELELQLAEEAIARCADGVILFPSQGSQKTIERFQEAKMPFVLVARTPAEGIAEAVVWDETGAAYLATRHLIESGHRKLAYVSDNDVIYSSEHRMEGFRKACDESGIPESDRCYLKFSGSNGTSENGSQWMETLQASLTDLKQKGFNGLFVFCDVEAWHILQALDHSDQVSRSKNRHIQQWDVLQSQAVAEVQQEINRQQSRGKRMKAQAVKQHRQQDQDNRKNDCGSDGNLSGSNWPVALGRMIPVLFGIPDIVDEVNRGRNKAETEKSIKRRKQLVRIKNLPAADQRDKNKQVLDIMMHPHLFQIILQHILLNPLRFLPRIMFKRKSQQRSDPPEVQPAD